MTQNRPNAASGWRIGQAVFEPRPLSPGLYLVSTPIGNLGDMTIRGLETLAAADVIACEDTRVTRVLLDRYGIAARPIAYHEHNARMAGPKLLAVLREGGSVALVSDAGTPLVSDPGYRLREEAIAENIPVYAVPGASAVLTALAVSGLESDAFLFAGFLPAKEKARRERFAELAQIPATLLFFESPNRIAKALSSAAAALGGERRAAVCRELTKAFEEVRRGTLAELAAHYDSTGARGEIVLVVAPPGEKEAPDAASIDALLRDLIKRMPAGKAASEATRQTGLPRSELYERLIAMKTKE